MVEIVSRCRNVSDLSFSFVKPSLYKSRNTAQEKNKITRYIYMKGIPILEKILIKIHVGKLIRNDKRKQYFNHEADPSFFHTGTMARSVSLRGGRFG